ncbi:hypothetical protein Cgig2_033768 [Carnegiea gigantea]|uniref:CCHC-type domain-containing protein n=1 Tax=Carnegiea gigantea TaxID=171969 RepID=A0A9Q1JZG5_9CARY|nr:hypothetical protein Cgig2_033768 [Carnegiea gigantea]
MAITRGEKSSNHTNRASNGQPPASPSQPKCRLNQIATGLAKRPCNHYIKTTVKPPHHHHHCPTCSCLTPLQAVTITLSRSVLESIFSLKFIDTAPSNITYKWRQHASDLTLEEATALQVSLPDTPSVRNVAIVLDGLKKDNATLRTQLDQIQLDMGLMKKKIDALIHLTSLIHRGAQLTVPFQNTDVAHVAQSADQIIRPNTLVQAKARFLCFFKEMHETVINVERAQNERDAFFNKQGNKRKVRPQDSQNQQPQHKRPWQEGTQSSRTGGYHQSVICRSCRKPGHYARNCRTPKRRGGCFRCGS